MAFLIATSLVLCACIQLGYWLFLFYRLTQYHDIINDQTPENLSIIVSYKNESKNIDRTLPLLLRQTRVQKEIITVDDFSHDNTKSLLNKYTSQGVIVTEPDNDIPGKKAAISKGLEIASNDLILFTDADCSPQSDQWASIMGNLAKSADIVLGYAPNFRIKGVVNAVSRYETWLTGVQYLSYAIAGIPYMGVGRNLMYRKSLFNKVGGFNGNFDLASGDDDLMVANMATKYNTQICLDPKSFVYSEAPNSLKAWFTQKRRHLSTAKHYNVKTKLLLSIFAGSHVFCYLSAIMGIVFGLFSVPFLLSVLVGKWVIQSVINLTLMKKLKEENLWIWFPVLDISMAIYYIIMSPFTFITNKKRWN